MAPHYTEAIQQIDTNDQASIHLDTILATIWMQLVNGAGRSAEPFHLGVLATSGAEGPSLPVRSTPSTGCNYGRAVTTGRSFSGGGTSGRRRG